MDGLQNSGRDVYQSDPGCDLLPGVLPGELEQQWHVNRFIVQKDAVMALAVFPERLAVVGHDGNQNGIEQALRAQPGE
jgi:hypothetical protein